MTFTKLKPVKEKSLLTGRAKSLNKFNNCQAGSWCSHIPVLGLNLGNDWIPKVWVEPWASLVKKSFGPYYKEVTVQPIHTHTSTTYDFLQWIVSSISLQWSLKACTRSWRIASWRLLLLPHMCQIGDTQTSSGCLKIPKSDMSKLFRWYHSILTKSRIPAVLWCTMHAINLSTGGVCSWQLRLLVQAAVATTARPCYSKGSSVNCFTRQHSRSKHHEIPQSETKIMLLYMQANTHTYIKHTGSIVNLTRYASSPTASAYVRSLPKL